MSDAYRHSALLLHGLCATDRQWILAQLNADQQTRLREQLTELGEIGIPADRPLVEAALQQGRNTPSAEVQGGGVGAALRAASGDALLLLLKDEPSWVIAAVLSLEAWPWREAIFVGLDASRRERVRQAIGRRPAAGLAHALTRELEHRLPAALEQAAASQPASKRGTLHRLFATGKRS